MAKKEKHIIEQKWLTIKSKSKTDNYNIDELDHLTCELIAYLSLLTMKGITEINGVSIDIYKDRVWWVVEKIGLLPEYRGEDLEDILGDDDEDFVDEEDIREKGDEYNDDEFDFKTEKDLINSLKEDWFLEN
jgi:hypothetical protein